jgi:allophanate hydrolase subunit 2
VANLLVGNDEGAAVLEASLLALVDMVAALKARAEYKNRTARLSAALR